MTGTNSTTSLRTRTREIIFGHDTPAGKAFDVALIWIIIVSVIVVMLDSVESIRLAHGTILDGLEWGFTILFTVEYILRLWCVRRPMAYAGSFFGIVDLVAILPTYLSLFIPGGEAYLIVRALRLLRVFRVLKLAHHVIEATVLMRALQASRDKITVFLAALLTMVAFLGSFMYLIEGGANGFTSIPAGVYWAIVTLTTVGYGDIAPQTPMGQALAAMIMILGYSIIAVPTGIITAEVGEQTRRGQLGRACPGCGLEQHDRDAKHCKVCGEALEGSPD